MNSLLNPVLTNRLIVRVVLVPIAANAVIGTILAIWQAGAGSRIGGVGKTRIGSVGTMVKLGNVLKDVVV